jgi:branched-chain amino acid transport system permease protein
MNESLKRGLRLGLIFGIVFIFFMLIGFTTVATSIIGKLVGNVDAQSSSGQLPVSNLIIFTVIMGFLTGISAHKKDLKPNWIHVLLAGLFSGLVTGLMVGGFAWLIGGLDAQGVDFRTYLPNLGVREIQYLIFNVPPQAAALRYILYFVLSSVVGALLIKVLSPGSTVNRAVVTLKKTTVDKLDVGKLKGTLENKYVLVALLVAVGALMYFLPFVWGSYWNYIMGTVAIYILLGLGLNIIVGYSGQLVLGYVAFFAIGAYTFAILTAPEPHAIEMNLWLAVLISMLTSTLAGLLIGLPILNLRGDYLAIVTLGFGEIVRILIKSDLLTALTNGPKGITNVGQPFWRGRLFTDTNYMHLLMLLVLAGLFVAKRLKDSRTGRAWISIREDQTVSQATGVNTFRYKILALLLGAAIAGLAGALFASRNQFTGPEDFTLMVSVNVLCVVIVGGMGSLPGVVLGAFVLKGLPELLRELSDYRLLAFGGLLVAMMILRPNGLWPVSRPKFIKQRLEACKDEPMEVSA